MLELDQQRKEQTQRSGQDPFDPCADGLILKNIARSEHSLRRGHVSQMEYA